MVNASSAATDPVDARSRWSFAAGLILVFAIGLALRLGLVAISKGGFTGDLGYDPGVYYAAADALIHGRLPYRDFTLLHPPGLMLVLAPFAAIGRATSDHAGFIASNVAFSVLGALNGSLVTAIARRLRWSPVAGLLGGLFYAVWYGTAGAEISERLEPLGNTTFLLALLLLAGTSRRAQIIGGIFLGYTLGVKIWWVVPVVVVLIVEFVRRDAGRAVRITLATIVTAVIVNGVFFVFAPSQMFHMLISDQVGRPAVTPPVHRIRSFSAMYLLVPHPGTKAVVLVAVVGILIALVLIASARRAPGGGMVIAVALSQLIVLGLSPSYFTYYSAFAGVGIALLVGAAAHRGTHTGATWLIGRLAVAVTLVAVAAESLGGTVVRPVSVSAAFPQGLAAPAAHYRCVMADAPMALIELNSLSRGLAAGCTNWVDVTGRTYGVDAPKNPKATRSANPKWQQDIRRYLLSGDAMIYIRSASGLTPATKAYLRAHAKVVAEQDGIRLYRVLRHG